MFPDPRKLSHYQKSNGGQDHKKIRPATHQNPAPRWRLQVDAMKDGSLTGLSPGIPPLLFSSIPLFIPSTLSLEALRTPSRLSLFIPHVRGQCVPHKNKPATQCEDLCVCPHPRPPKPSFFLSHLLVPYRRELVPFTALPSPLERTSQGPNSAILCLIAPAPPWRTVPSKNLWRHGRKWTGFVLSLDI